MPTPAQPAVRVFPDLAAATAEALQHIVERAKEAVAARGCFFAAVAGGNTPTGLYTRLAKPPAVDQLAWQAFEIFFTDERCVAPDDPQSNYGMVKRTLLDHAPLRRQNIHRIEGELEPSAAAVAYEAELKRSFDLEVGELPRFDFILLGMGPDGHTASLFPETAALGVRDRLAVANHVPQMDSTRITLTAPVLNNARDIIFLVAGADKADALQAVLEGPHDPERLPSQLIALRDGRVTWLLDQAAAGRLQRGPNSP